MHIKLNNYVVQLIGVASVLLRHGFFTIFLLLNDMSHDAHFSTRQNMEPEDFLEQKIKFFSPRVFQIFDFKHGSPENYSDFFFLFFKLNNYVVQLIGSSSVQHDFGLLRFFLLLNDSSHDAHFSTRQNMEPEEFLEKKSNFSLHGFSRYSTPNMALQKIILTSFFVFCFFSSSSSRSRAMRSPRHNFSKILSNRNEILQTYSGVNVVVPNTFWLHLVQGFRS